MVALFWSILGKIALGALLLILAMVLIAIIALAGALLFCFIKAVWGIFKL